MKLLEVCGLQAGYGGSRVLMGVDLTVDAGQVVTLLGRNGMGKTTTVRCLLGLTPAQGGSIRFAGRELRGLAPYRCARLGLGIVPEGRQVFPTLTVRENLVATAANRSRRERPWTVERVYRLFPRLQERAGQMGYQLSGGEQQMVAIGRALLTNPRLLILDEATEGLAPMVRQEIWDCLRALKAEGQAILLIDKNLDALLELAGHHYIMEKGRVVWDGSSAALAAAPHLRQRHLGV